MIRFLAGFTFVYAALYAWSLAAEFQWLGDDSTGPAVLAAVMIAFPVLAAWAAAEIMSLARPPRLFDRRVRRGPIKVTLGLATGIVGTLLGAGLLPVLDVYLSDGVVLGGSAAAAAAGAVLVLPRIRPGHCVFCGYDLRDGPSPGRAGSGRCPECGKAA